MHSTRPRAQSPMRATDQQQTGVVVQQALLGLSVLLQLLEPSGRLLLNGMHVHPHSHSTGAPAIGIRHSKLPPNSVLPWGSRIPGGGTGTSLPLKGQWGCCVQGGGL